MAADIGGEVISADSRQVYRGMDIGTGKDLADYVVDGRQVPYHLIDIAEPGTKYNLFEYQRDFHEAYQKRRGAGDMRRNGSVHRGGAEGLLAVYGPAERRAALESGGKVA